MLIEPHPRTDLSLLDAYVTICTTPAYPDLDIIPTGHHTIQIGLTYPSVPTSSPVGAYPHGHAFSVSPSTHWHRTSAFLYRPDGTFLACMPVPRLFWLHT